MNPVLENVTENQGALVKGYGSRIRFTIRLLFTGANCSHAVYNLIIATGGFVYVSTFKLYKAIQCLKMFSVLI